MRSHTGGSSPAVTPSGKVGRLAEVRPYDLNLFLHNLLYLDDLLDGHFDALDLYDFLLDLDFDFLDDLNLDLFLHHLLDFDFLHHLNRNLYLFRHHFLYFDNLLHDLRLRGASHGYNPKREHCRQEQRYSLHL